MTHSDETRPGEPVGVLVVDDEDGIGWWSTSEPAVVAVPVVLGRGVVCEVDAARPDQLLYWSIAPGGDPAPLATAVGDPTMVDLLTAVRAAGPSVTSTAGRRLTPTWQRVAHVAALDRCLLYPVDDGALLIDEAVANLGVGDRRNARRLYGHAEYALVHLTERAIDRELPSVLADLLREALRGAAELDVADAATRLAGEIPDPAPAAEQDLVAQLTEWIDDEAASVGSRPIALGGADRDDTDRDSTVLFDEGYLDIGAVPPRIIAWNGPDIPDLQIEHFPAQDRFVITAALAAGVEPTCREVAELIGWTADAATGALLAVMPVVVRDGYLVAELPARGRELFDIEAGVTAGGVEPSGRPAAPGRRELIRVDRSMFESWNQYRAAISVVAAVGPDADRADVAAAERSRQERLGYARTAAMAARATLRSLVERTGSADAATGADVLRLRARLAAVQEYLDRLTEPPLPGTDDPTLVELVVPNLVEESEW